MAAMLPAGSAFAAAGSSQPPASGIKAPAKLPRPASGAPAFQAPLNIKSCAYVRAHRAELARSGQHTAACLQAPRPATKAITRPPAKSPARSTGSATRSAQAGIGDCAGQPDGQWLLVDRTDECMQQTLGYVVYDVNDGTVVAGANVSTSEEIELSTTFWDWDELVDVSMTNPFGNIALLDTEVAWVSNCTAPCTPLDASAFTGDWADLSPGQTVAGSLTLEASVPVDGVVSMPQSDELIVFNEASANPYAGASWNDSYQVRCDDQIGEGGCVFPDFLPNLVLPESQYGASAALILWAQVNQGGIGLPYGAGPPLRYLANSSQAAANRNVICYDGTFVPDPGVPNDSCDEFPFASSYQSGAMNGYSGAQCAEVEPVYDPSLGWVVNDLNGIVDSGCTRGHVPLSQNQAVGGALGNFIVANRILDYDPYTVQVTAS